jgi:hypothetical protein
VSVCVQAFPSLQAVPFAAFGFEQVPVAGLHVPATWHWSLAVQVTGLPGSQTPVALHVSKPLQGFPSLHDVPAGTSVCVQRPFEPHVSVVHGLLSLQLCAVQVGFGNPSSYVYAAFELPTSRSRAMNAPFAQIPVANDSVPFGTSTSARMLPLLPKEAATGVEPIPPLVPLTPDTSMRMSFAVNCGHVEAGPMKKLEPADSFPEIRIFTVPSAWTWPPVPIVRLCI